jgi:hypothetical protein
MSKTVEIEFEPAHDSVPNEKVEEAINDLRKRLENFERGGVSATMRRIERSDMERLKDSSPEFQSGAKQ